ncbi:MAG: helix-turn-helix domain-containing protein [Cyclobacteriaceae bacterium]
MIFSQSVFGYLLLTGALHGFYLVLILLTSQAKTKSPYSWLIAIVIGPFSIYLANSFIYLSDHYLLIAYTSGTSMPFLYLVGPAYWLYLQFITGAKSKWNKIDLIHLAPMVICFLAASPYYFMDINVKLESIMNPDKMDLPVQRGFYFGGHLLQTLFYLGLSFTRISTFKNSVQRQTREFLLIRNWTIKTYTFMASLSIIYFVSFVGFIFFREGREFFSDLFDLSLTAFIHLTGFWMIKDSPVLSVSKSPAGELRKEDIELKNEIETLMLSKPYLDSDYSLKDLSDSINTNTVYASQMINLLFQRSFTDYINQYRIEEAKQRLENDTDSKLFAIALDSGFSNKNTFSRVFKKYTGRTPSEYRELAKKR